MMLGKKTSRVLIGSAIQEAFDKVVKESAEGADE